MLTADAGRVPGQLYSPQPYILPLRIAAPPRVGKSATALLVASLAKRIGMVTCYSVAPNKTVPMMELQKKLQRIGWRNFHSGARDGKYTVTAANGGVYDAAVQAESMFTDDVIVREKECSNLRYAAFPVDELGDAADDCAAKAKTFLGCAALLDVFWILAISGQDEGTAAFSGDR